MNDDQPDCAACQAGAISTPATHYTVARTKFGPGVDHWCAPHSLPGDLPLAGAVALVRRRVWPELGEPRGMNDE